MRVVVRGNTHRMYGITVGNGDIDKASDEQRKKNIDGGKKKICLVGR